MDENTGARRPIATREKPWAMAAARRFTHLGIRPNTISIFSIVFSGMAAACLALSGHATAAIKAGLYLAAACFIQLRLLCNLLDGMVAVEGGRRTRTGELFNDLPDRISDTLVLVGAGYALPGVAWGRELGWLAAVLALLTAYIRQLGGACGAGQTFAGPMAKQHRMATLTVALLLGAGAAFFRRDALVLLSSLWLIVAGCLVTCARRLAWVARQLERQ